MMRKKTLFLLACISIVLLLTLVSCGEPKSAEALYAKVDETMGELNSYEMDLKLDMTFYVSNYKVSSQGTGHAIEDGLVNGDYYFYQETNTTVESKGLSLNETQKSIEAYDNGNYFILNQSSTGTQKMYSPLTAQEVLEYRADHDMGALDVINDCTNQSFSKKEDGTWELICSGYTKSAIATIEDGMGLDNDMFDAEIMDMKMTLSADAEYHATKIELEFVFEDKKNAPAVSITIDFSKYDAAVRQTEQLNTENYTKVEDIRLLKQVEAMLEEMTERENGSFTLSLTQLTRSSTSPNSSTYKETDEVTFGEGESGYFYDIDATVSGTKYDISYKDGTQTIKTSSKTQNKAQTEKEARDYIKSLINSAGYAQNIVTAIEKRGNGVYRFTCNPNTQTYETYYANMGGTFKSATQTITVTITDDQLTKIQSAVTAQGSVINYGTITLTVNTTVTFD